MHIVKIIFSVLCAVAAIFAIVIAIFFGMEKILTLPPEQVLTLLGVIVAGIGISVALWLARRNEKVRMKCAVDLHTVIYRGPPAECCVSFQVTNLGVLPITVDKIGCSVGTGSNKIHRTLYIPESPISVPLPKRLEHGESANFQAPVGTEGIQMWMQYFAEQLGITKINIKTLRVEIHIATGHVEIVKPSASFTNALAAVLSS